MIYQFRWLITISYFMILMFYDWFFELHPLYLHFLQKKRDFLQLKVHYDSQKMNANTKKKPLDHQISFTPYLMTSWVTAFTNCIASFPISIKKMTLIAQSESTTEWHIVLSGNAYSLSEFFYSFYKRFPWLSFSDPTFLLQDQHIEASFRLLALKFHPTHYTPSLRLTMQNTMPFCDSMKNYAMQSNIKKNHFLNGFIQYGNTKTILKRTDHEHFTLSTETH